MQPVPLFRSDSQEVEVVWAGKRPPSDTQGLVQVLPVASKQAKASPSDPSKWSHDWVPFERMTDCDDSDQESKRRKTPLSRQPTKETPELIGSSQRNLDNLQRLLDGRVGVERATKIRELTSVSQFTLPELIAFARQFQSILFQSRIEKGPNFQADLSLLNTRSFRKHRRQSEFNTAHFRSAVFPVLVSKFNARMGKLTSRTFSESQIFALCRLCTSPAVFDGMLDDRSVMEGILLLLS